MPQHSSIFFFYDYIESQFFQYVKHTLYIHSYVEYLRLLSLSISIVMPKCEFWSLALDRQLSPLVWGWFFNIVLCNNVHGTLEREGIQENQVVDFHHKFPA